MRWWLQAILWVQTAAVSTTVWLNYQAISLGNTQQSHFDTIIVLGVPSAPDGGPSPEQRSRVEEGVREYKAGVAPRIIMTGGAAHNQFVEAHTMKLYAESLGVPEAAVVEEDRAHDTIQNEYFSNQIMQAHGWRSAEIVSSPSHLPRASLIAQHYTFKYHMHAAPWPPEFTKQRIETLFAGEAAGCWRLTHEGFPKNQWLPGS